MRFVGTGMAAAVQCAIYLPSLKHQIVPAFGCCYRVQRQQGTIENLRSLIGPAYGTALTAGKEHSHFVERIEFSRNLSELPGCRLCG